MNQNKKYNKLQFNMATIFIIIGVVTVVWNFIHWVYFVIFLGNLKVAMFFFHYTRSCTLEIVFTNDHAYVPLVVNTSSSSWSFPRSWLITGFVTRLTRQVSLVEQELLTKKGAFNSQPQVIKFTSCLPMVGVSLRVLWLLPPLKLIAMI